MRRVWWVEPNSQVNWCLDQLDIIIVEDDPYYFLQMNKYVPKDERKKAMVSSDKDDDERFIASLAPSYLKCERTSSQSIVYLIYLRIGQIRLSRPCCAIGYILKGLFRGCVDWYRLNVYPWKTIAPGCRLGWFTCNPVFAERLERQGETTTQAPCGFGQVRKISRAPHAFLA